MDGREEQKQSQEAAQEPTAPAPEPAPAMSTAKVDALRAKLAANQTVLDPKADLDPIVVQKGAVKGKDYTRRYMEELDKRGQELLGEAYSQENIAKLVGAPPGSTVKYYRSREGTFEVKVEHPDIDSMRRTIYMSSRPVAVPIPADRLTPAQAASQGSGQWVEWVDQPFPYIKNEELFLKKSAQGKGLGLDIFSHQVQAATELGIKEIHTHAARSYYPDPATGVPIDYKWDSIGVVTGYKTWPKMGYDQPISQWNFSPSTLQKIKIAFPDAKTVQDILDSSVTYPDFDKDGHIVGVKKMSGQQWWDKHGTDLHYASFDLTPGSRSHKKLEAYQEQKGYVPKYHEGGIVPGQGEVPAVLEGGELVVPKREVEAAKTRAQMPETPNFWQQLQEGRRELPTIGELGSTARRVANRLFSAFSEPARQFGSTGFSHFPGESEGLFDSQGTGQSPDAVDRFSRVFADKADAIIKAMESLTKSLDQQNAKPPASETTKLSPLASGTAKQTDKKQTIDPALIRQGAAVIARAAARMFGG